jgi:vanillate/3-O-methylgallate O-demethylase
MLRNAPAGPYQFPIKAEFSNWRDEQAAWRNGAVLFDQSFHMTDLHVRGKDTRRLVSDLAVNSMANWKRDIAKQFVHCNEDGYYTGDAIIFILEEDQVNIVNKPNNANWVMYHAEKGGYDVECELDSRALDNKGTRKGYRFEVQGPNAWAILEKLNGRPIEGFKFFGMGEIDIAGPQCAGAAPRDGWRRGPRTLRSLRGLRPDPRRHPRGRRGTWGFSRPGPRPTPPWPMKAAGIPSPLPADLHGRQR